MCRTESHLESRGKAGGGFKRNALAYVNASPASYACGALLGLAGMLPFNKVAAFSSDDCIMSAFCK